MEGPWRRAMKSLAGSPTLHVSGGNIKDLELDEWTSEKVTQFFIQSLKSENEENVYEAISGLLMILESDTNHSIAPNEPMGCDSGEKSEDLDDGLEVEQLWEDELDPGFEPKDSEPPGSSPASSQDVQVVPCVSFLPGILRQQLLPASVRYRLAERNIFIPGIGPKPTVVTARIPISLWIFGVKVNRIIDTGSERSYMNFKVHQDTRQYASSELRSDDTTKRGVLLANYTKYTLCKTQGGASFIVQVGSTAGEQYFSMMNDLSHSVVLGMDFALSFDIQIDCKKRV